MTVNLYFASPFFLVCTLPSAVIITLLRTTNALRHEDNSKKHFYLYGSPTITKQQYNVEEGGHDVT